MNDEEIIRQLARVIAHLQGHIDVMRALRIAERRADGAERAAAAFDRIFPRLTPETGSHYEVVEPCGARPVQCIPWGQPGACPREGHDHDPCALHEGHSGEHVWADGFDGDAVDPSKPAPATYSIDPPPPVGSTVETRTGARWVVHPPNSRGESMVSQGTGDPVRWVALLSTAGAVTLVPEDQAVTDLYGPPGARWGTPDEPCPYVYRPIKDLPIGCALGRGHAGAHWNGGPLGETEADGSTVAAGITPQEAAKTPCTCGHPEAHRDGCPRYERITLARATCGEMDDEDPPNVCTMPPGHDGAHDDNWRDYRSEEPPF